MHSLNWLRLQGKVWSWEDLPHFLPFPLPNSEEKKKKTQEEDRKGHFSTKLQVQIIFIH